MDWWEDGFCEHRMAGSRFVIRYDHRDTGRSSSWPAGEPGYTAGDLTHDPVALLDALGVTYQVMGGPTHCCGVMRLRAGDTETYGRVAEATIDKLSQGKSGQVISWCPSCQVQIGEMAMPQIEKMRGARPFQFAQVRDGVGLPEIVAFIETAGGLVPG